MQLNVMHVANRRMRFLQNYLLPAEATAIVFSSITNFLRATAVPAGTAESAY